jgi:hypothetical protein
MEEKEIMELNVPSKIQKKMKKIYDSINIGEDEKDKEVKKKWDRIKKYLNKVVRFVLQELEVDVVNFYIKISFQGLLDQKILRKKYKN